MADLTVRGPNVTLRYPSERDAPALFELASDADVTHFFSWGPYRELSDATDWLATLPARRADGIALELGVADTADQLLGSVSLLEFSLRDRRCVIGIWIGRPHWGSGTGDEAEALLAQLAFGLLRMERLSAWVDVNNRSSQRHFTRLGFTNEGVLRAFQRHDDERRDLISYSLLREEFDASPLAAVPATISGTPPPLFVCAER
jgi:ribosomal-protein-alanine N-acetyltransferase